MGNTEELESSKAEKSSSPAPAYYGPRVAAPPYLNPPAVSGHPPHAYMWALHQPMMPPYGAPYAPIYAHGGVYTYPGVPIGSSASGQGAVSFSATSEAKAAIPLNVDTSAKSSVSDERGLMNKLKRSNGLEMMSVGNGSTSSTEDDHGSSQSEETEGSSNGTGGNLTLAGQKGKKRSRKGTPDAVGDGKIANKRSLVPLAEVSGCGEKTCSLMIALANAAEKFGPTLSPNSSSVVKLRSPGFNLNTSQPNALQSHPAMSSEAWSHDERDLKGEKRKQSNRESARRSRLRKQAETEELSKKVHYLTVENMNLKSEISKLEENSEQLRLKNAELMVKLQACKIGPAEEISLHKDDETRVHPDGTADLLARISNSDSVDRNEGEEVFENKSSGTKLNQLLHRGRRTDAVAVV